MPRAATPLRAVLAPTVLLAALALAAALPAAAVGPTEVDLAWYLPEVATDGAYDPAVPPPSRVLGHEVGEWHARPEQLVAYLGTLAEASDRVTVEEIGRTHERRPQVVATITSPANHARLDQILAAHRALSERDGGGATARQLAEMPVVVYLGYSIHGNEPSGSNASLLLAYHLAASESAEVAEILDRAVVLVDPSLNPDGLGRFAHWANMYRGRQPVADPGHREHVEAWPGGRTNHYWFDLNRDWLLLQHPESRHRVALFQRWRPNVLADYHEMGTRSTYFFQPGVPTRQNPLTPPRSLELTRELARFHAEALDELGSLYYTEESFDDFYYGKGSTYPDIQGSIGILFEQASARGHVQEAVGGDLLTFPFAIRNQLTGSLSTLRGAVAKREELLAYQRDFYREALDEALVAPTSGYVVGDAGDPARLAELVEILHGHGIEVHRLGSRLELGGTVYTPGAAIVVPHGQRQARLVEALFERRTEFPDTTFYDVSAWTLPLAFGLPYAAVPRGSTGGTLVGSRIDGSTFPAGALHRVDGRPVAWAFEWTGFYAPRTLGRLLDAGVRARVATRPFTSAVAGGAERSFGHGTVIVPLGLQPERAEEIETLLAAGAREDGTEIWALPTGLTPGGVDLGSPSVAPLARPEPLLVIGDGISSYDAGEVWFFLDHRLGRTVSLVDSSYLGRTDLSRYTHLFLVGGWFQNLPAWDEATAARLGEWVRRGGTLVTLGSAATWAEEALLGFAAEGDESTGAPPSLPLPGEGDAEEGAEPEYRPYGEFSADAALPLVSGTIFEAALDTTHPLAYGYTLDRLPLFRTGTTVLQPSDNPYVTPVRYTEEPLLGGYVSPENLERLSGTPAVIATRLGGGVVIRMADDPVFRGVWYGSAKLLANALFFGPVIERTEVPEGVPERGVR